MVQKGHRTGSASGQRGHDEGVTTFGILYGAAVVTFGDVVVFDVSIRQTNGVIVRACCGRSGRW